MTGPVTLQSEIHLVWNSNVVVNGSGMVNLLADSDNNCTGNLTITTAGSITLQSSNVDGLVLQGNQMGIYGDIVSALTSVDIHVKPSNCGPRHIQIGNTCNNVDFCLQNDELAHFNVSSTVFLGDGNSYYGNRKFSDTTYVSKFTIDNAISHSKLLINAAFGK